MPYYYPELPPISWSQPFFVLGLTGSPGSGKSTTAACFAQCGAQVFDADKVAKQVLHSSEMEQKLIDAFGPEIYDVDQAMICRQKLASIVFAAKDKRELLNNLIHPQVQRQLEKVCTILRAGDILVYDVPLLFEGRRNINMDLTVTVDAPEKLRYQRVHQRNGWSWQEFRKREASQFSAQKKQELADLVIVNKEGLQELQETVYCIYTGLERQKPKVI